MNRIVIRWRCLSGSKVHPEVPVGRPDTEFEAEAVARPGPSG